HNSGTGTSKLSSTISAVRFWRYKVSTTNTAHWNKSAELPDACPAPACWKSPTAATRRNATNPTPSSKACGTSLQKSELTWIHRDATYSTCIYATLIV